MAKLPILTNTLDMVDAQIEAGQGDWRRAHLGASVVGKKCERAVWYSFRWHTAPEFSGRILRLFRRGQAEEAVIVEDFRNAGITVSEGPRPGEQWKFRDCDGHFGGSMDGKALGLALDPDNWHVLEFKTHNEKSYKHLTKHGVEKSKPEHFAQMQAYMHMSGIDRAAYVAVNKNDDYRYMERVAYDRYYAGELIEKAKRVIFAHQPPPRISDRPDSFLCNWCDHYDVCHQGEVPEKNCRTCQSAVPVSAGNWKCKWFNNKILSEPEQKTGCKEHSPF